MRLLVRRNFGPGWVDENLYGAPTDIRIRVRLLAHSQSLQLTVVKSEVLHQVLAHNHGSRFGEHQVLLSIAFHARRHHDHRKAEFVISQELAAGV